MQRLVFICLLGTVVTGATLLVAFLWNGRIPSVSQRGLIDRPIIYAPDPPLRQQTREVPQPLVGESPDLPLRPGRTPRISASVEAKAIQTAQAFLDALNASDASSAFSLMTGYEDAAERMRQAALRQGDFLERQDLSAQQRLGILALRDRYDRAEIEALSAADIMLVNPGTETVLPIPKPPILLGSLRLDDQGRPRLRLVQGARERTLSLIYADDVWRVDTAFMFDPSRITQEDAAILTQVGEKGGGDRAWLQVYAAIANTDINLTLLNPPFE